MSDGKCSLDRISCRAWMLHMEVFASYHATHTHNMDEFCELVTTDATGECMGLSKNSSSRCCVEMVVGLWLR